MCNTSRRQTSRKDGRNFENLKGANKVSAENSAAALRIYSVGVSTRLSLLANVCL